MVHLLRLSAPRRARRRLRLGQNAGGYLLLSPWLVGFFGLTLGPILASLYLSLTDYDLLTAPVWAGVRNYVTLFTSDPRYLQSLKVTVIYVATSVPLKLAFALLLAAALSRGIRGVGVYRTIFYLPALIGGSVAIAIMWRQLFGAEGLVNQALALVGLQGPSWISDPRFALDTLVALAVWQVGAPMVIFLAGLKQIPRELYEAATVDGAGPVARFVHVTIPVITPLIFFNLVLQMIGSFQSFNPAYIISGGSGGPADATLFYTLYLYNQAFTQLHMGYAAAMAWVLLVLVASVTVLNFLGSRYWVFYQDQAGTA